MINNRDPSSFSKLPLLRVEKGWLAVDKPCGVSVHNEPGQDLMSLLMQKIETDPLLKERLGIASMFKVQPVHRLDRETSGVILFSVNGKTLKTLSDLFVKGLVRKQYTALVHGTFDSKKESREYGKWCFPLSKEAGGRNNPAGDGKLVPCCTKFKVIRETHHYALLDIELKTGRKHQIRRHAKLSGHPVTGDTRYGSAKSVKYLQTQKSYHRLGLHCRQLEFTLTGEKGMISITSENPLAEMIQLLSEDGYEFTRKESR
ncbi:MAG: RNA pseudouridine synthase [Desulfobacula sp.]|jgi:23S rRNA-/tRNA-specific pseudouridylate synthase